MKGEGPDIDPAVKTLLEQSKSIRRLPVAVRARVLERARQALLTPAADHAVGPPARVVARRSWLKVATAAAAFLALAAAGALAAYRGRGLARPEFSPPSLAPAIPLAGPAPFHAPPRPPPIAAQPIARTDRLARRATARESYAVELRLLQRAQALYAAGDFSAALRLVAEHRLRFPNGRLVEEREALRVRSLAGSGRAIEARRAVARFGDQFPRSVLLPRLEATLPAAE